MDLTVATLNLHKGEGRWGERAPLLVEQLVALRPDVIGFQEVDLRIDQGNWICRRVNDLLWGHVEGEYAIHHMANPRDNVTLEALAIMTRYPVVEHEGLDYLIRQRVAHRARCRLPDGNHLDLYNTHFHHVRDAEGDRMRETSAEKLLRWIDRQGAAPHVIVGDFNALPASRTIQILKEGLRSACETAHGIEPARTLSPMKANPIPGLAGILDYIFVSPQITVLDAKVVFDRPDASDPSLYPSDHFGLTARLQIR